MSSSAKQWRPSSSMTLAVAVVLLVGAVLSAFWRVDHSLFDVGLSLVALLLAALLLREVVRSGRRWRP